MEAVIVKVKKLYDDAVIPTYGSDQAAGCDLYAHMIGVDHIQIPPHHSAKIGTGIAVAIPEWYWGGVYARSGLATKQGLAPANKVGVIDADYRGEIIVALHNDTDEFKTVRHGDRIAQLVITPRPMIIYNQVNDLDETERGSGGFGHTGV